MMREQHEQTSTILREVMTQLSFAIVTLNKEATITFASSNISALLGYSPTELLYKSARDFLHLNDVSVSRAQFDELIAVPFRQATFICKVRHSHGRMIWVEANVSNLITTTALNSIFLILRKVDDINRQFEYAVERTREMARQEERHLMAIELHDNINQMITATKLLIESAKGHSAPYPLLAQSSSNLAAVIEEIRKLTSESLRFSVSDFGLAASIHAFVESMKDAVQLKVYAHIDEYIEQRLTQEQKHQLFRIFQEGWNNTTKYAQATHMWLSISADHHLGRLELRDDGIGFDVNETRSGVGLISVSKRVKAINGHYHIQSSKSQGTIIQVHFPLNTDAVTQQ
jgi:PAS domain S-box-containing protein